MALESGKALTVLAPGAQQKLAKNAFDFTSVSLKIKASYKDGQVDQAFTMNVKMIRDSVIWTSVSAFGIEISRALITVDSFKLIDRLRKQYIAGDVSELKNYTKQEFSLKQLQDLLIGNALFTSDAYEKKNDDLRNDHLKYADSILWNTLILTEGFRIKSSELANDENTQKALVDYEKFRNIKKSGSLPTKLKLDMSGGGKKIELSMDYVTISIDPVENLSFIVPSKYAKRM